MWFMTNWTRRKKITISSILGAFYIVLFVVLMFLLNPSVNSSGISLPFDYNKGQTTFMENTEGGNNAKKQNKKLPSKNEEIQNDLSEILSERDLENHKIENSTEGGNKNAFEAIIVLVIFAIFIAVVIFVNLKFSRKKIYDNPFVDTDLYDLPLADNAEFPTVHYLKLALNQNEKILFATQTINGQNPGDLILTNQRVVFISAEKNVSIPIDELETAFPISDNTLRITTTNEEKYYAGLHDGEMKITTAVLKWICHKIS